MACPPVGGPGCADNAAIRSAADRGHVCNSDGVNADPAAAGRPAWRPGREHPTQARVPEDTRRCSDTAGAHGIGAGIRPRAAGRAAYSVLTFTLVSVLATADTSALRCWDSYAPQSTTLELEVAASGLTQS